MSCHSNSVSILSFRDALGVAMELADDYAFVNAAVVIDHHGNMIDLIVAEGIGRSIQPIISWMAKPGSGNLLASAQAADVLFITVRPFDSDIVREHDLRLYRRARWAVAEAGANLIDWIETDSDLFRSYAYLCCPATAWTRDPPEDRISDGTLS